MEVGGWRAGAWNIRQIKDKLGPHENSLKLGSVLVASDGTGCPAEAGILRLWSEKLKECPGKWSRCGPQANRLSQLLSPSMCELQNSGCFQLSSPSSTRISSGPP